MRSLFKRIVESWPSKWAIPLFIALGGSLIVFGVTQILSPKRSHKDLVRELRSPTFGNRWVAAYELSKLISRSSLPERDIPWVVENLARAFTRIQDGRTQTFIVVALGALKHPLALPSLAKALTSENPEVVFQAVVALSRFPPPLAFDWSLALPLLQAFDNGLVQVAALTLATHRVPLAREPLVGLLGHSNRLVRFSAGMALINYKEKKALPILKEILNLPSSPPPGSPLEAEQIAQLKRNLLDVALKNRWAALHSLGASQTKEVGRVSKKAWPVNPQENP